MTVDAYGPIADGVGEHTCIYFNGELFHDPMPNGKGLKFVSHYLILKKKAQDQAKEKIEIENEMTLIEEMKKKQIEAEIKSLELEKHIKRTNHFKFWVG